MLPHEALSSLATESPGTTMQQSKFVTAGHQQEQKRPGWQPRGTADDEDG